MEDCVFRYTKYFDAALSELNNVIAYIEDIVTKHDGSMKTMMLIDVCVEEIFVNIASYAYENMENKGAEINVAYQDGTIAITFIDSGMEFDPLAKEDPDITAKAEDREIGGLGILMVKKSMDKCEYERKNGKNIFTVYKKIN